MRAIRNTGSAGGGGGPPPRRAGYTLLEVILALAIAVMLFSALYVTVNIQLRHTQAGRELIEQSTLVRSVFNRMSADVQAAVTLPDPARFRRQQSGSGQGGSGA